jgi:hypothetical protein
VYLRPVWYWLSLGITVFWFISIPYSRFLMGVHSLDQIFFGLMLGTLLAYFLHFVVRDHFIAFFDDLVIQNKHEYNPLSNSGSFGFKYSTSRFTGYETAYTMNSKRYAILGATLLYFTYEVAAIITYNIVNQNNLETSEHV